MLQFKSIDNWQNTYNSQSILLGDSITEYAIIRKEEGVGIVHSKS